jgi:SAM-dependent methyltransferase
MDNYQPIPVFGWFYNQFTLEGRGKTMVKILPHLAPLFQPGDRVLDLCCGAGPVAFYLEEQGAQVTGIDFSPELIELAQEEATRQGSQIEFIQGNAITYPLGDQVYDLIICLGNAVLDFPHQSFTLFRDHVHGALKPGGHLALEYIDGLSRVKAMSDPFEVVEQGVDGQVLRRFKGYDPASSVYHMEYSNLVSDEVYEYTGYIYTGPTIRIAMEVGFEHKDSIRLDEADFLDVYVKR